MYDFSLTKSLEKTLFKLQKKNKLQHTRILDKVEEVVNSKDINHYKNLRKPLQHLKRVHIDSSFVLIFSINGNHILFKDFDHHDNIYKM